MLQRFSAHEKSSLMQTIRFKTSKTKLRNFLHDDFPLFFSCDFPLKLLAVVFPLNLWDFCFLRIFTKIRKNGPPDKKYANA